MNCFFIKVSPRLIIAALPEVEERPLAYFVPVNSKNGAGMRQRLLSAKRRPSERQLNTGPPSVRRAESRTSLELDCIAATRVISAGSLMRMSSAWGRSNSI